MAKDDLQKVTMNLYQGDYDKLRELFPDTGAGPVIRKIIRNFVTKVEQERATAPVKTEFDI